MKRKLLLLNLGLAVLLAAGLWEFRRQVKAAQQRYEILQADGAAKEMPAYPEPELPQPVRPAGYMPVVERLLFSPDRNPIVEVEAPAPEPIQRPGLPLLAGVMDFGQGPIALMAPDPQTAPKPVAVGEKIGEYVFRNATADKITLEWRGETFEVWHTELVGQAQTEAGKSKPRAVAQRRSAPARRPAPSGTRAAANAAKNVTAQESGSLGGRYNIGHEVRPGAYAADPRDESPPGTVYQGLIKKSRRTPFGTATWWEKVTETEEKQ